MAGTGPLLVYRVMCDDLAHPSTLNLTVASGSYSILNNMTVQDRTFFMGITMYMPSAGFKNLSPTNAPWVEQRCTIDGQLGR